MKRSDIFWQTYLNLERELIDVSKYVYITDVKLKAQNGSVIEEPCQSQLEVYSPLIADLLIQCCVQIEALSKELYFDLEGAKTRGDNTIFFDEDCLKDIDKKWGTHNKAVLIVSPLFNLTKDDNRILKPLREAHKRSGNYWERAYQAVKHDRYTSLSKGNIKALLHAMAALYLLNLYYRQDTWNVSYDKLNKLDMSGGSSVFAVNPPTGGQLWYGNKPIITDSPYIVEYEENEYKKIKAIQDKEDQSLNEYLFSQPELNNPDFIKQLEASLKKQEKIMPIWELGKFRINVKINRSLPFEDRKKLLLTCPEWQGWIHQHNNPRHPDEITEDNIQDEIDRLGIHTGMEIMKKLQPLNWVETAMSKEICVVRIG